MLNHESMRDSNGMSDVTHSNQLLLGLLLPLNVSPCRNYAIPYHKYIDLHRMSMLPHWLEFCMFTTFNLKATMVT